MKRMSMYLCILSLLMCMPLLAQADSGAVYAMTNPHLAANAIVVYSRADDGTLALIGTVATGGMGYVIVALDALGSQGPLILSPDSRYLIAVNAGDDTISVFAIDGDDPTVLTLVENCQDPAANPVDTGGSVPVSLTIHNNLLYVLHAGGLGNITGFTLGDDGCLTPLADSTRSLNNPGVTDSPLGTDFLNTPAQVGFNPLGDQLVVTVKGAITGQPKIHVFAVGSNGLPSAQPATTMNNVPFAFVFDPLRKLIVTEPFGDAPLGTPESGAASSYRVSKNGSLISISPTVGNGQLATCWIAITSRRVFDFAYASNNATDAISSYFVGPNGRLLLLDGAAASSPDVNAPVDLAITPNNRYLYNVNAGSGTVSAFMINPNGSLTSFQEIVGLPTTGSAVGIAVR